MKIVVCLFLMAYFYLSFKYCTSCSIRQPAVDPDTVMQIPQSVAEMRAEEQQAEVDAARAGKSTLVLYVFQ